MDIDDFIPGPVSKLQVHFAKCETELVTHLEKTRWVCVSSTMVLRTEWVVPESRP